MLRPNLLKSQIPYTWGRGRGTFQLLMPSPSLLKSQIPYMVGEGYLPTFDAESKSAKTLHCLCWRFCWKFSKFFWQKVCHSKKFILTTNGPSYTMCTRDHKQGVLGSWRSGPNHLKSKELFLLVPIKDKTELTTVWCIVILLFWPESPFKNRRRGESSRWNVSRALFLWFYENLQSRWEEKICSGSTRSALHKKTHFLRVQ